MSHVLDSDEWLRHPRAMWLRRACLLPMLLASCTSWNFNGNAPALQVTGSPPELSTLQKLNDGPVYSSAIVSGADGAYWLTLQEVASKLKLIRLSPPEASAELDGDQFTITWRNFFVWKNGPMPTDSSMPQPATLTVVSAAQPLASASVLQFPDGIGSLTIGGADDVFVYVPPTGFGSSYKLIRVGQLSGRDIPFPGGDAGRGLNGAFFSGDGKWFYDRAPCASGCDTSSADLDLSGTERSTFTAHAVDTDTDVAFGLLPRRILPYDPPTLKKHQPPGTKHVFFTCGSDGVKSFVFDTSQSAPSPTTLLDPTPCASDLFANTTVTVDGVPIEALFYMNGTQLRYVPLDGSAPPANGLDRSVSRVLQVDDLDFIIYSQTPADKYIYGVGDGWLNGWKFMNRGRAISQSFDGTRLRFLENAAQDGGIGELFSTLINGTPEPLALNVYQYDELGDGRLLAADNHAYTGTQNRIIVIDEKTQTARWVVDQASQYNFIPGSTDLIVDIVTGASSFDLVRVPVPPADAADAAN